MLARGGRGDLSSLCLPSFWKSSRVCVWKLGGFIHAGTWDGLEANIHTCSVAFSTRSVSGPGESLVNGMEQLLVFLFCACVLSVFVCVLALSKRKRKRAADFIAISPEDDHVLFFSVSSSPPLLSRFFCCCHMPCCMVCVCICNIYILHTAERPPPLSQSVFTSYLLWVLYIIKHKNACIERYEKREFLREQRPEPPPLSP